jgi:hypothetical protein
LKNFDLNLKRFGKEKKEKKEETSLPFSPVAQQTTSPFP